MGLSLLLLMASVLRGEMRGSMELTIRLQSGHLQVQAQSYDENKTSLAWEDLVEDPAGVASKISALAPVKVATPRLIASGIIGAGEESVGVRIIGIDPASEANAPYRLGMVSGEFLNAEDREGLLMGRPLADKLGLYIGDTVNLLVNTSNGDVDQQLFSIRGIYSTGTPAYDEGTIFLPLAKAQAIARAENHASTIFVLLDDRDQTAAIAAALQSATLKTVTWEQANALILETEKFAGAYMMLLYLIILSITVTVIINTLVMAVFERTREIGILSAIGMKGGRIMAMFFAESGLLGILGILMGLVIGSVMVYFATTRGIYIGNMGITGMLFGDRIYAYPTLNDTITLTITAFIVTLLAALYPALLAARLEPVDALRGGQ
jgi:ABC-type lipoprotein release transport system permease subunit